MQSAGVYALYSAHTHYMFMLFIKLGVYDPLYSMSAVVHVHIGQQSGLCFCSTTNNRQEL